MCFNTDFYEVTAVIVDEGEARNETWNIARSNSKRQPEDIFVNKNSQLFCYVLAINQGIDSSQRE
jgi:hypothetical protein